MDDTDHKKFLDNLKGIVGKCTLHYPDSEELKCKCGKSCARLTVGKGCYKAICEDCIGKKNTEIPDVPDASKNWIDWKIYNDLKFLDEKDGQSRAHEYWVKCWGARF